MIGVRKGVIVVCVLLSILFSIMKGWSFEVVSTFSTMLLARIMLGMLLIHYQGSIYQLLVDLSLKSQQFSFIIWIDPWLLVDTLDF